MTPHTPGPLYAHGSRIVCDAGPSGHVATAYTDEPWKSSDERVARASANAAEIARRWNAYPDLLAACEECVAWMDAPHRETDLSRAIVKAARSAIARAKGGAS